MSPSKNEKRKSVGSTHSLKGLIATASHSVTNLLHGTHDNHDDSVPDKELVTKVRRITQEALGHWLCFETKDGKYHHFFVHEKEFNYTVTDKTTSWRANKAENELKPIDINLGPKDSFHVAEATVLERSLVPLRISTVKSTTIDFDEVKGEIAKLAEEESRLVLLPPRRNFSALPGDAPQNVYTPAQQETKYAKYKKQWIIDTLNTLKGTYLSEEDAARLMPE